MKLSKFLVMMVAFNLGLFVFNVTNNTELVNLFADLSDSSGNELTDAQLATLNDNPDNLENITFNKDNNTDIDLGSGGVSTGTLFNTIFLLFSIITNILFAQLLTPWTIIQSLGFPAFISLPFGILLFILNLLLVIELIRSG